MASLTKQARLGYWLLALTVVFALGAALVGLGKLLAQPAVRFPTIVGQNCGTIRFRSMTQSDDPGHGALCLWRAFTTSDSSTGRHAVTLVVVIAGIDISETHVITLQSSAGSRVLTDTTRRASASVRSGDFPIHRYVCASLRQQFGGLLLSGCGGERNIYIPPPAGEQASTLCGTITNASHTVSAVTDPAPTTSAGAVASIEDCFWQAYVSCAYPASLNYELDAPGAAADSTSALSYTLNLQAYPFGGCGFSYVETHNHESQSQTRVECARLARQSDGSLVTQGCDDGVTLVIPPATPPNP